MFKISDVKFLKLGGIDRNSVMVRVEKIVAAYKEEGATIVLLEDSESVKVSETVDEIFNQL
jgi:hypothetical protein